MISRDAFGECVQILKQFPVLGIVGSRQCGKTTLAKQLKPLVGQETLYLDLEDPRDLAKLAEPELYLSQNEEKLIILDEIQIRPDLFNLLRSLIDRNRRPARFIILGSATPGLLRGSADSLAGRIAYIELSPFSWKEIKNEVDQNQHWFKGGYPDALLAHDGEAAQRWLKNYLQTYVQRDLGLLGLSISPSVANRLLSILSHIHGDISNFSAIAKSLGITSHTARRYCDFLTESFILRELKSFYTNTKKRLVKSPKLYYRDTGLLHYLHRIPGYSGLLGHPVAGSSWEGYVVEETFRKHGEAFDLFFYRTQRGAEVDLVLAQNGTPKVAVEIKLTNSPKSTRGFYESIQDLKTPKNFIVTPGSEKFPLGHGIEAISFQEFMELDL